MYFWTMVVRELPNDLMILEISLNVFATWIPLPLFEFSPGLIIHMF